MKDFTFLTLAYMKDFTFLTVAYMKDSSFKSSNLLCELWKE
jgi:hypothetical protein